MARANGGEMGSGAMEEDYGYEGFLLALIAVAADVGADVQIHDHLNCVWDCARQVP